ncbi:MAG: hypothetical protein MI861_13640 [Pirellulales bacterium]|nr:hypothetical protein [Pirellulales bacterium]
MKSLALLSVAALGAIVLAPAEGQETAAPAKTKTGFTIHHQPPEGTEEVYQYVSDNFGFVPNLLKVMAGSPGLLNAYLDTQDHLKTKGTLCQPMILSVRCVRPRHVGESLPCLTAARILLSSRPPYMVAASWQYIHWRG